MNPGLFSPLALRKLQLKNRIAISPMCQYSAVDGFVNDWHVVQYGRFAVGGAGLVTVEATAIAPEGRITPGDLGIWSDERIPGLRRITSFIRAQGAASCLQLGHAGRKAATQRPWHGSAPLGDDDVAARSEGPWPVVAPSALPMAEGWPVPHALDEQEIRALRRSYQDAAVRAREAGFDAIELHCAHGYLLHQFLSPLSNRRSDRYGGDRAARMRVPLEIAADLRKLWPADRPVLVRISAVDNIEGGIELDDSIAFARELRSLGIDAVDCSSGGLVGGATVGRAPRALGYQVPYAEAVRREAGTATVAVGLILTPDQANDIIAEGRADLVAIGRAALDDPNWPLHAERALKGESYAAWPPQHGWWLDKRAAILRAIEG